MLDPRALEHEIAAHALTSVGRTRSHVHAFGKGAGGPQTAQELNGTLNGLAIELQARPVDNKKSLSGRIGRMTDAGWWRRNVRRELLRENETIEHAQCRIRRKGQCYVSDHAMHAYGKRAKANRATLENLEVCNELGEAFNLAEVADGSVSNPKLRRAELMMRCRGFEETAAYMHHDAVMITITCPSRFHRFNAKGLPNEKWTGATPRDGQNYLCDVFAKIRAAWSNAGYSPYGFRVVEPHHDGCPHWHILLFMPPDQTGWFVPRRFVADRDDAGAGIIGLAGRYALEDSAGEPGAIKHRFTVVHMDPSKGSATGYIAKYICKNIDGLKEDGEGMGLDFASGQTATKGAARVRVWASVWGIRQFQPIGGPSVTVWRELRRLGKDLEQPLQLDLFEWPRSAADRALWALFWVAQGGPEVKRRELTLRPFYHSDGQGRYGDETKRVIGVWGTDPDQQTEHAIQTRVHSWTIQRAGLAAVDVQQAEHVEAMARRKNIDAFLSAAGVSGIGEFSSRTGAAGSTWTGVNNCTDGFDLSGFEGSDPAETAHLYRPGAPGDIDFMLADLIRAETDLAADNARWSSEHFSRWGGGNTRKFPHESPDTGPFGPSRIADR